METIEGNKLIGGFMGWTLVGNRFEMSWKEGEWERYRSIKATEFNYHQSWNKLMPVVDKIHGMLISGELPAEENREYAFLSLPVTAPIQEVWDGVTQFLQVYNQPIKTHE